MRFQFKKFQREDYARIAMQDGAILGHDTGGGKGLATVVLGALKVGFERGPTVRSLKPLAPVLIVAPGDLHDQVRDDAAEKFRATMTVLDSKEAFLRLSTINPSTGLRELPPGYYIASYTQLASNGVADFPPYGCTADAMRLLSLGERQAAEYHAQRAELFGGDYERLKADPDMSLAQLVETHRRVRSAHFNQTEIKDLIDGSFAKLCQLHGKTRHPAYQLLEPGQKEWIRERMAREHYAAATRNIGESHWSGERKFHCVYDPTLADLCRETFACVIVDEGVKMKGEDTIIGKGLRSMNPAYRYVLTATPIKNRLPDVFRLAHWSAGGKRQAHARFPYPDTSEAREEFSSEFLISERNLTDEEEKNRRYVKLTPQVCNVNRLWKMFAPIILRRRKADFGEDIVKKNRNVIRAPMGKYQMEVYRFHLLGEYKNSNGYPAIGPQLQSLRIAAANPGSGLLKSTGPDGCMLHPPQKGRIVPTLHCSPHTYVPKVHSALQVIRGCLERKEQFVVASAFQDSLDELSNRLRSAGVTHEVCDGRKSQKKRGDISREFKCGPSRLCHLSRQKRPSKLQGLLVGVESCAEGHDWPLAKNLILMCYSWAWDKFEQIINRIHRLTSPEDVNVWVIICDGSIDRRLESLIQEKGDAAELVLDGKLAMETTSEVNLAELLHTARAEFTEHGKGKVKVVDERDLEKQWPALQRELAAVAKTWSATIPTERGIYSAPVTTTTTAPSPLRKPNPNNPMLRRRPVNNSRPAHALVKAPALNQNVPALEKINQFDDLPLFAMMAN